MAMDTGTATAVTTSGKASRRRLRLATVLAPTAILLVLAGPAVAAVGAFPLPMAIGQPLFAGLGAIAAGFAVYHADASDDLPRMEDQNLRLLMLMLSLVTIAIAGAWLWLGLMNLTSWLLGSGAETAF